MFNIKMDKRIESLRRKMLYTDEYYPKPVAVEYPERKDLSEPMKIAANLREYMLAQEVVVDKNAALAGQLRFDGSVPSELFHRSGHQGFIEGMSKYYRKILDDLAVFEWQHSVQDYAYTINHGIAGYEKRIEKALIKYEGNKEKTEFLKALQYTARTIVLWAHKCSEKVAGFAASCKDEKDKRRLENLASDLLIVPEYPAGNFRQAILTIYVCFEMLPDGLGTLDRNLYPFYERDINNGVINDEFVSELLAELFIRVQAHTPRESDNFHRSAECHFVVGGYLPDGKDGFNELSKLILKTLMSLDTEIPECSLRWTPELKTEDFRFVMDCERKDKARRIAIVNDEPRIAGLEKHLGLDYATSCNYTMVGCNEPCLQGTIWMGGNDMNVARSIISLLFGREKESIACETFTDFYSLFESVLENEIDEWLDFDKEFDSYRSRDINVLSSLFIDGCIENAESVTRGGCNVKIGGPNLIGLICLIDSLTVIKQFVYDEKKVSMKTLIEALKKDWLGYERLRNDILKHAKFFGNGEEISDGMSSAVSYSLQKICRDKKMSQGQTIIFGSLEGYNPYHELFARLMPATPDGRRKGEGYMIGVGQARGKDRNGLAAVLDSVAKMDPADMLCGPFLCNITVDESLVSDDEKFDILVNVLENFFRRGGMHIQLNYLSPGELEDAQRNPSEYSDLKVRVSGYSGYFVRLDKSIQDEIILRTKH